jgi:hypothetical protein
MNNNAKDLENILSCLNDAIEDKDLYLINSLIYIIGTNYKSEAEDLKGESRSVTQSDEDLFKDRPKPKIKNSNDNNNKNSGEKNFINNQFPLNQNNPEDTKIKQNLNNNFNNNKLNNINTNIKGNLNSNAQGQNTVINHNFTFNQNQNQNLNINVNNSKNNFKLQPQPINYQQNNNNFVNNNFNNVNKNIQDKSCLENRKLYEKDIFENLEKIKDLESFHRVMKCLSPKKLKDEILLQCDNFHTFCSDCLANFFAIKYKNNLDILNTTNNICPINNAFVSQAADNLKTLSDRINMKL